MRASKVRTHIRRSKHGKSVVHHHIRKSRSRRKSWAINFEPETREFTEKVLEHPEYVINIPHHYNAAQQLVATEAIIDNPELYNNHVVSEAKKLHQYAMVRLKLRNDYPKEIEKDIDYNKLIRLDASGELNTVPSFQEYTIRRRRNKKRDGLQFDKRTGGLI